MAVPASSGTEHHVAALHAALVHLAQVNGREVDFEGTLITESLETDVTLYSLLPGRWADVRHANVVPHLFTHFRGQASGVDLVVRPV